MKLFWLLAVLLFWPVSVILAENKKDLSISTPTMAQELEVEKLKLEIERLKLENERLQLQIQGLKMGNVENQDSQSNGKKAEDKKQEKKPEKNVILEMTRKSEELSKQFSDNEKMVVLDFTNGDIWFKGTRYSIYQFKHLCDDEKWGCKGKFVKMDINGDSCYRYQYNNLYLDRYQSLPKGIFIYESKKSPADLEFITPEGINQDSPKGAVRNRFETPYFNFDNERTEKESKVLRYKHGNGFLAFDDVLEFWIDKNGKIEFVKWGWLDKK